MKRFVMILIVSVLLLHTKPIIAAGFPSEGYEDLYVEAGDYDIPADKEWRITFAEQLEAVNLLENKIFIIDSDTGFIFPVILKLDSDLKTIVVTHRELFYSGSNYTLYINKNIKNADGEIFMKTGHKFTFAINSALIIEQLSKIYGTSEADLRQKKVQFGNWKDVEAQLFVDKHKMIKSELKIDYKNYITYNRYNGTDVKITDIDICDFFKQGYNWDSVNEAIILSALTGITTADILKEKGLGEDSYYNGSGHVSTKAINWNNTYNQLKIDYTDIAKRFGMTFDHINYLREMGVTEYGVIRIALSLNDLGYAYWKLYTLDLYSGSYKETIHAIDRHMTEEMDVLINKKKEI